MLMSQNNDRELGGNAFTINNAETNICRAMYVDNFETILGDVNAENTLLSYAQSHDIKTLLLYGLHVVNANYDMTNPATNFILADFISKAKTIYGVQEVGATAENGHFFTTIIDVYNNSRTVSNEKFDIYNLEFEYWSNSATEPGGYYCTTYLTPNGLPCTVDGAFQFYISILQTINNLATNNTHPIITEAYVGWPTTGQADTIGANLDRLRLHAYVGDPNIAFNYSKDRLIDFANGTPELDVSIIFSSEPNFMQTWLENNSMVSAENIYITDLLNESVEWTNNVNLEGFTYFTYTDLTNVSLEVCPNYNLVQNISIYTDTTIYAGSLIELDNVVVHSPYELTLIAPEVIISTNCEVMQGAKLTVIEDECSN